MPSKRSDPLERLRARRDAWRADPVSFAEELFGLRYVGSSCEVEGCGRCMPVSRRMLEAVRDERRTIVSACHDSAKTFTAGVAAWWWSICWPRSVVITTSSTGRQVERGVWKEIRTLYARGGLGRLGFPEPNLDSWNLAPDWYMVGFSTRPDDAQAGATRVQGTHSEHLLLIMDEATAVHRLIWDAAKGSLTQEHNHWLVLANPTDPASEFGSVWRTGAGWHRISISAFDLPNLVHGDGVNPHLVTRRWVEEYRRDVGESSPMWQARVLGVLPSSSVDTLISTAEVVAAFGREPPAVPEGVVSIGCDVARYGTDLTAIYVVRGGAILHEEAYGRQDTVFTAGRVAELAREWGVPREYAHRIAIDDTGVGGGVTDILRSNGWGVRAENFGSAAQAHPERYRNRRTELWIGLRDWVRETAMLGGVSEEVRRHLEGDLCGVKYEYTAGALMQLEAKSDMKKRLGHSPDHGDALALAVSWRVTAPRLNLEGLRRKPERSRRLEEDPDDPREDRDHPGHEAYRKAHEWDGFALRGGGGLL